MQDANLSYVPTWCPGCGDYGILNALKKTFANLGLDLEQTVLVTGIGCSGKIAQYVNTYRIETLHGRALPVATGIKLANHNLTVIAEGGDGDGMGLGIGHFVHTARRNLDISYFIHNNQIYGLTKGQSSPTSELGAVTKFTPAPLGNVERPVNIARLALGVGATFVARSFAGDMNHLVSTMMAAIRHKGFAVIDILQPCVSFNRLNTYQWYQERIQYVEKMADYDPKNMAKAVELAATWGEAIPVGIIYQEERITLEESLPQLKTGSLVNQPADGVDISPLLEELT
ncbi:MAG TPA: 2-oxoacid:ferredoxin oxidoreductase subunit beta [Methylomusa anaerophila]|uniref:2-oxoglutarate oxidoreductase subunit KorB n=1 Tax=Methylomusa anaerophila TaxID=1930071 RepID=A0A348AIU4_9FIRM|nr:2-oxoacid:ferredoxin oxidoreductase subunit beta [Methylomusa anaerophila]BBB90992.1 2-oxoglutarate oxidoreductase subunit KorB [Methylomusa anaerophila]HML88864.1 2-oxoacid:ferredoxin oxidoreductase subunit beta [Methylomusa anaerophila]